MEAARHALDQRSFLESGQVFADGMAPWLSMASGCQREMIGFVARRLAKDGDTMREVLGSRSPVAAMEIHSRWAQETIHDYSAEMTRMFAIYARLMDATVQWRR